VRDPFERLFTNRGGELVNAGGSVVPDQGVELRMTVRRSQLQREKAIAAYRRNIALEDVHIADRRVQSEEPAVLGEDGETMTWERRCELMRDKETMVDEQGRVRGYDEEAELVDYTGLFDGAIESETLGESSVKSWKGIRVVQPRELDIEVEIGEYFGEDRSRSEQDAMAACIFTTGRNAIDGEDLFRKYFHEAIAKVLKETKYPVTEIWISSAGYNILVRWGVFPQAEEYVYYGAHVKIGDRIANEIRLVVDEKHPSRPRIYASLFLENEEYEWEEYHARSEDETDEIKIEGDENE